MDLQNAHCFADIENAWERNKPWGITTNVDLLGCHPEKIRSPEYLKRFVIELCDIIKMTRHGECHVEHFGDDDRVKGYTVTQLIKTSSIQGHIAEQTNNMYWDIFSCKIYNPWDVLNFANEFFEATEKRFSVLFRDGTNCTVRKEHSAALP